MTHELWLKQRMDYLWAKAERYGALLSCPDAFSRDTDHLLVVGIVTVSPQPIMGDGVPLQKHKDTVYIVFADDSKYGRFSSPEAALEAALIAAVRLSRKHVAKKL